ncbi:MAG: hypothetical protein HQL29_03265 [Candidatus Omnitrophica bacterium]|nr:hypothetical protein [Candidatus Omnitrophota bacterium]
MMINLISMFFLSVLLSGCIVTAASGTRTEYVDTMKSIEKDYKENKITEAEYEKLKERASHQGDATQQTGTMSPSQEQALKN